MEKKRRNSIYSAEKKRRKKCVRVRWGRIIVSIFVLVLIIAGAVFLVTKCGKDTYNSEKGFERYANKYFDSIGGKQEAGEKKESLNYGKIKSSAMQYPELKQDITNEKIAESLREAQDAFNTKYNARADKGEGKFALLIGYESYKTEEKVSSVVIRAIQKEEVEGNMEISGGNVYAYTYVNETGMVLYGNQVFKAGYKAKLAPIITDKIEADYAENLTKDYKEYLSDDDDNYQNFAMTHDGIKFYFNPGTIADENVGIVGIEVSYKELEGIKKDEISLRSLDPSKPMVALTYDDGPGEGTSDRILDVMEKYGVVATFFEVGTNVDNVKGADEILQREIELGCEVGQHTYSHIDMLASSESTIKTEIASANKAIKKATGQEPTIMRPPYGNCSDSIAKIVNLPCVNWSVDTRDWSSRNADSVCKIIKDENTLDGKVILMHSVYDSSAQATEQIVPWLIDKGYQLVTVSELLTYKYKEQPTNGKFYGYNYFYLDQN